MRRLIEEIMNNNYVSADELFRTGMSELVEHIVLESKKIVASQMVEEKKNDHDYDDPPFDPDKKKSTPWKNPHSKAKHLAREMMKKYKKKEKKLDEERHPDHYLHKAIIKAWHKPGHLPGGSLAERDAHINKSIRATRKQIDTAIKLYNKKHYNLEK